jgi:hypothetical protein
MYANLRDANGNVLGSVAVDPTQAGGLQGALSDAMQKLQAAQGQGLPMANLPPMPSALPPGARMSQPYSQSRPFVCQLRYMTQAPNGQMVWATTAIPCPQGLPPGIYIHTPGNPGGR